MDYSVELQSILRGATLHLELLRMHGIDAIPTVAPLMPETAPQTPLLNTKDIRVAFLAGVADASSDDEKSLVEKIAGAIGLKPQEWRLFIEDGPLDTLKKELESSCLEYIVIFGEKTALALFGNNAKAGYRARLDQAPVVCTHAPSAMLKDDRLKKETWEHLQGALKALKK